MFIMHIVSMLSMFVWVHRGGYTDDIINKAGLADPPGLNPIAKPLPPAAMLAKPGDSGLIDWSGTGQMQVASMRFLC
ncbi:MAG TPA: hypothetical protein VIK40_09795 [Geomonas sp.]